MGRRVLNFFLLLALLGSLGLHVLAGRDLTQRNTEIPSDMAHSPAYGSFAANPNFPDGKTLQPPQPGTIPRGLPPLPSGPSLEHRLRAGDELHNPFEGLPEFAAGAVGLLASPPGPGPLLAASELTPGRTFAGDDAVQNRGAFVYANYCQVCHGPEGKGDGPIVRPGFPQPASLLADHARQLQMNDGQMFYILTYGQQNMPPAASQLSREDRWKVILHVRSLQRAEEEKRGLPVFGARTAGLLGSPLGQGPLLAASTLFPGRTEKQP
jgi:mono/diheme cytochrome c family protein